MTLACNPELTLLTNMAASSPIVGGTSMALAESCVMIGSEGGKILRCHPRKKNIKKLFAGSDSNIHWDKSAIDFFDNLPPCITSKLIKHVELWANSVSRQVVSAKDKHKVCERDRQVIASFFAQPNITLDHRQSYRDAKQDS